MNTTWLSNTKITWSALDDFTKFLKCFTTERKVLYSCNQFLLLTLMLVGTHIPEALMQHTAVISYPLSAATPLETGLLLFVAKIFGRLLCTVDIPVSSMLKILWGGPFSLQWHFLRLSKNLLHCCLVKPNALAKRHFSGVLINKLFPSAKSFVKYGPPFFFLDWISVITC